MKKLIAAILCIAIVFGGCAVSAGPTVSQPSESKPTGSELPSSRPAEPAAPDTALPEYALALAQYPQLPVYPDENAVWDAVNKLDYEALGEERYRQETERLWEEFDKKQNEYITALHAFRGERIPESLAPAFKNYTGRTLSALLSENTGKNVVYSPANLYLALCMLTETVDGDSRAQLLDLLGLKSTEEARAAASSLWRNLYRNTTQSKTLLANSVWLNEQIDCRDDTVKNLADYYFASAFRAPMGNSDTDKAIASWINENTNNLLKDAADSFQTDPLTVMALISTLYFKGTWTDEFNSVNTHDDTFTNSDGTDETIAFMHRTDDRANYIKGDGWKSASLPMHDGAVMRFLLPDEGVSLETVLENSEALELFLSGNYGEGEIKGGELKTAKIDWSVPKFDVSSDLELTDTLKKLGVTDVFDDTRADFTPLTEIPAYVSTVQHAARVKADEQGCEGAAFTAISVEAAGYIVDELPTIEMNLNRPFLLLITGADGLPLFVSAVNTTAAK